MALDERIGAMVLYAAVRDTLKSLGADIHSHPYDMLDRPSAEVWLTAWRRLILELNERDHIVADWQTMKRMLEGDPKAAMWRDALADPPSGGESV